MRQRGWLITDHLEAYWYRIVDHRSDWSEVRVEVTAEPDEEEAEITVAVLPNRYVLAQECRASRCLSNPHHRDGHRGCAAERY